VACIIQVEGFSYNLQQVVSAFLANAHPDWEKWDILERACRTEGVEVTALSAQLLWDIVSKRPVVSMFSEKLI
jgi:hypothetical protein